MNKYFLKLNKDKTQILLMAPPNIMNEIHIHGTFIDRECVRFISCAKNLGVWIDENLNFKDQISKLTSTCFRILKEIANVKYFISEEHLKSLVVSLILSRLDNCNGIYYKITQNELSKLQAVQNAAVRLIYGRRKFDHQPISHLFVELHWLKVKERIIFKISITVHKCIWGIAPSSLKKKIRIANPRIFTLEEIANTGQFGERAFSRAGPKIWNCLPLCIRTEANIEKFKKLLKSHLLIEENQFYTKLNMK